MGLSRGKRALAGIAPLLALVLGMFVIGNISELAQWVWDSPSLFWTASASVIALLAVWALLPRRAAVGVGLIVAVLPWGVGASAAYFAAYTTPAWATEAIDEASRSSMLMMHWAESLSLFGVGALLSMLLLVGQASAAFATAPKRNSSSTLLERLVLPALVLVLAAATLVSEPPTPPVVLAVAGPAVILLYLSASYLAVSDRVGLHGIVVLSLFALGHFLTFINRSNFYRAAAGLDPPPFRLIADPRTFQDVMDGEILSVWAGPAFALAFTFLFSTRAGSALATSREPSEREQ